MPREGGEIPRPRRSENTRRQAEVNIGSPLKDKLLVAGQVLGIGTLVAAGGFYAVKQGDTGSGLLNRDEPRVERVTTGQLFADAQLASADSLSGVEKEDFYSAKLEQAEKEMAGLITPDVVERIRLYEPLIRQVAEKADIPQDLFLGQAIAESLCDPDAVSESVAAGLFQIMPYLYEKYEIDPFDPAQNAELAAKLLKEEYGKFSEWSLAIWPWHIGDPEVFNAVQTFAHLEYATQLPDEKVELIGNSEEAKNVATQEALERMEQYKDFIKRKNITVSKLFENSTIQNVYSGEGFIRTEDYLPRIEVSVPIYNSKNSAQIAQQ